MENSGLPISFTVLKMWLPCPRLSSVIVSFPSSLPSSLLFDREVSGQFIVGPLKVYACFLRAHVFLGFWLGVLLECSEAHSPPVSCLENHGRLELVVDYSWQLSQQAVLCLVPSPSSPSGCMTAHLPDLSTLASLAQTLFCVFHCHFPFCFWYGDFPVISLRVSAFIFSSVSYSLQFMGVWLS